MKKPGISFLERLAENRPLIGTMLSTASTEVAEALSMCGFEWVFLDAEHSTLDAASVLRVLQAVAPRSYGVVRLPDSSPAHFKKMLEAGCDAIIVPMVNSVSDAEHAVRHAKYGPVGSRGVGLSRAQGYGLQFSEYLQNANRQIGLIVQIEHKDAVAEVENIVRVPGIDAILIGPYDLSASLGMVGQVSAPEVANAIARVRQACREVKMPCGSFSMTAEQGRAAIAAGERLILLGVDVVFMTSSAKAMLGECTG